MRERRSILITALLLSALIAPSIGSPGPATQCPPSTFAASASRYLRSLLGLPEARKRHTRTDAPEFLLKADRKGIEWARLFVRYPDEPVEKPEILEKLVNNATDSMIFFDRWFRGPLREPFKAALQKQHEVLMRGASETEDSLYGGYFKGISWSPLRVKPGNFVHDLRAEKGLALEERFPTDGLHIENDDSRLVMQGKPRKFQTRIEGIPPAAWPENFIAGRRGYAHQYPMISQHPRYLARMEELMETIRKEFPIAKDTRLLTLLADYYHVAINAHPFYRGNNSLFMSQVNYILQLMGYRGIPHTNLDYQALVSSTAEFRELFLETVGR